MSVSVPNLHVSTSSKVTGSAMVFISSRADPDHVGEFEVNASVSFNPASDNYPTGRIKIAVDLTESLKATFASTSIELINSFGKHNPTIIFTGRCTADLQDKESEPKGCKYWIIIADNLANDQRETPAIVGFVIIDRTGSRIAYGTGPVKQGRLVVDSGA
jgi:hypothetical protein